MDLDDLLDEWRHFTLREREKEKFFSVEPDVLKNIKGRFSHCLIEKLLTSRIISKVAIKNALIGAWRTREDFEVELIGKNLFLFKFECNFDKDWIFKNGPWFFDKYLLILEQPVVNVSVSEIEFKKAAFWLRLFNLPLEFRNKQMAKKLGDSLGEFLEVECDKEEFCGGNSMRIKVRLDITEPLCRGFMLKSEEIREGCWIAIRYERLPEFCFKCGRIGHVLKDCHDKQKEEMQEQSRLEFGMWLRFQGFGNQSKKPNSNQNNDNDQPKQKDLDAEGVEENQNMAMEGQEVNLAGDSSPVYEEPGICIREENILEKLKDQGMFEEGNKEIDLNRSGFLNELAKESDKISSDSFTNSAGVEISSKKKSSWKRRARLGSKELQNKSDISLQKRKRGEESEEGSKKSKTGDGEDMVTWMTLKIWQWLQGSPA